MLVVLYPISLTIAVHLGALKETFMKEEYEYHLLPIGPQLLSLVGEVAI